MKKTVLLAAITGMLLGGCTNARQEKGPASMVAGKDWPVYGGNRGGKPVCIVFAGRVNLTPLRTVVVSKTDNLFYTAGIYY